MDESIVLELSEYQPDLLVRTFAGLIVRYEDDTGRVLALGTPKAARSSMEKFLVDVWDSLAVATYIVELGYGERALKVLTSTLKAPEEIIELPTLGKRKITED